MLLKELLADTSFLNDLAVQLQPTVNASKRWNGDISNAIIRHNSYWNSTNVAFEVPLDLGDFELRITFKNNIKFEDMMEHEISTIGLNFSLAGHGWEVIFPRNSLTRSLNVLKVKYYDKEIKKLVSNFVKAFNVVHKNYLQVPDALGIGVSIGRISHQISGLKTLSYLASHRTEIAHIPELEEFSRTIRELEELRKIIYTKARGISSGTFISNFY